MSNLFASRLAGLERHYASLMSTLDAIENRANEVARSKDYNNLPAQGINFDSDAEDTIAVSSDFFWLLAKTYDGYNEFAKDYFGRAPRGNHDEILNGIVSIARDFEDLVEQSVTCEIDALARLWFYQSWENSANSFDAYYVENNNMRYYEVSNFKLLAHAAHTAKELLNQYFGYLANKD